MKKLLAWAAAVAVAVFAFVPISLAGTEAAGFCIARTEADYKNNLKANKVDLLEVLQTTTDAKIIQGSLAYAIGKLGPPPFDPKTVTTATVVRVRFNGKMPFTVNIVNFSSVDCFYLGGVLIDGTQVKMVPAVEA